MKKSQHLDVVVHDMVVFELALPLSVSPLFVLIDHTHELAVLSPQKGLFIIFGAVLVGCQATFVY